LILGNEYHIFNPGCDGITLHTSKGALSMVQASKNKADNGIKLETRTLTSFWPGKKTEKCRRNELKTRENSAHKRIRLIYFIETVGLLNASHACKINLVYFASTFP
jgi:hypothetical protein